MLVTIDWIKTKYNKFNKLYFDNQLPTNIEFKISRSRDTWGCASYHVDYVTETITPTRLTISNFFDSPEHVKENTLIHEMIHILDYVTHPEHYVAKHKSNRRYDAHGTWFQLQALKFEKLGYVITEKATAEEEKVSKYSEVEKRRLERKKSEALLCAVICEKKVWICKTDIYKVKNVMKLIKKDAAWIESLAGKPKEIVIFKTNYQKYAERRSCATQLVAWLFTFEKLKKDIEKKNLIELKKQIWK